mmetsp:Transcript_98926/g.236027  ORF Transcript_98926/g.236027 Transcript_98926/m.236027 type:complete len:225 (+) Transcript_98926:758-1432(+)
MGRISRPTYSAEVKQSKSLPQYRKTARTSTTKLLGLKKRNIGRHEKIMSSKLSTAKYSEVRPIFQKPRNCSHSCHKSMRPLAPIQEMAIHAGRLVSSSPPKIAPQMPRRWSVRMPIPATPIKFRSRRRPLPIRNMVVSSSSPSHISASSAISRPRPQKFSSTVVRSTRQQPLQKTWLTAALMMSSSATAAFSEFSEVTIALKTSAQRMSGTIQTFTSASSTGRP